MTWSPKTVGLDSETEPGRLHNNNKKMSGIDITTGRAASNCATDIIDEKEMEEREYSDLLSQLMLNNVKWIVQGNFLTDDICK